MEQHKMSQPTKDKRYLGDSVYVEMEQGLIKLYTWNGYWDDPRNRIYLEPEVAIELVRYLTEKHDP
jgi:hypothetical protein